MKRLFHLLTIAVIMVQSSVSVFAQSVQLTKAVYSPGESITVNFSGFAATSRDWVGLAAKGLADGNYTVWQYTNGQSSGTLTFNGLPYGEYEARGYFNNGAEVKARAYFRVGNVDQNTSAKTEQTTYKPLEKMVVLFSGIPGNSRDWIGLAKTGTPDDQYVQWQYLNSQQSGRLDFPGLPEGNYEVRSYFNNDGVVRTRYPFTVGKTASTKGSQFCRAPLSVFFAGMTGLGAAWARTTCEPTFMSATGISDIQGALGNARDGLEMLKACYRFDIVELTTLINEIPTLTNVQAEAKIHTLVRKLQVVMASANATCDNGITLTSLYVSGVHLGAAQAHASCRQCQPAPMPMAFQTVIRNHLNTARDAFANFLPCTPGVSLSQFDAVPLGSANSLVAHTHIVGLHTNLLWNISLSDCCCDCR